MLVYQFSSYQEKKTRFYFISLFEPKLSFEALLANLNVQFHEKYHKLLLFNT